ncbi:hypothetical protein FIBSPDRAFT_499315 [Athelia psychrophila]|uniref:Uncharacterized protein n=1 Tax=Athelia psychrophila TaxID=1759441 RepID=A0A166K9D4_9AGAM|nr:hypothetical protein FIBSPDRAFT_499315 [Fibularhizoctonia sp. CBS 109695]
MVQACVTAGERAGTRSWELAGGAHVLARCVCMCVCTRGNDRRSGGQADLASACMYDGHGDACRLRACIGATTASGRNDRETTANKAPMATAVDHGRCRGIDGAWWTEMWWEEDDDQWPLLSITSPHLEI